MDKVLVSSLRVNASMNSNATLVKPVFTASFFIGGPVLVGGVESTGLARSPVFSMNQGGSRQIGIGGTETSRLARGSAYQVFDSSGNLSLSRFVLNPDF
jgi:hypothetical protein